MMASEQTMPPEHLPTISLRIFEIMRNHIGSLANDIDAKQLDDLTDMLIEWCRKNGRDPTALCGRCELILERFRNGERHPDKLFADL